MNPVTRHQNPHQFLKLVIQTDGIIQTPDVCLVYGDTPG
jgi:hypothetical protein